MISEGKGRRAPKSIVQTLDSHALRLCFLAACNLSRERQYATSADSWKRGHVDGLLVRGLGWLPSDYAPRFIGFAGEAAAVLFLNDHARSHLSIDDHIRQSGDGDIDINLWGLSMQVKTRQAGKSHSRERVSLVRHSSASGKYVFPKSRVIICAEMNIPTVLLLGWCYSDRAKLGQLQPARRGNHTNIEIADADLEPMASLVDLAIARRGLSQ